MRGSIGNTKTGVKFSMLREFGYVLIIVGKRCNFDTLLFTSFLGFLCAYNPGNISLM